MELQITLTNDTQWPYRLESILPDGTVDILMRAVRPERLKLEAWQILHDKREVK